MVVSVFGVCGIRILWVTLICPMDPTNFGMIYYCFPVSWILTAIVHLVCFLFVFRRVKARVAAEEDALREAAKT